MRARRNTAAAIALLVLAPGCATVEPYLAKLGLSNSDGEPEIVVPDGSRDTAVYQRASLDRAAYLEHEVEQLRADLRHAEEAMVAIESGLRGAHTRADAVSALAEARIAVERATRGAPWRPQQVQEARSKLEEAERQFQAGHAGSAVFFASRAKRIAETLNDEAAKVSAAEDVRFVTGERVNLRGGPSTNHKILGLLTHSTPVILERTQGRWLLIRTTSGQVGWLHSSLVAER